MNGHQTYIVTHNVTANTPAWLWRALHVAQSRAGEHGIPVVCVADPQSPYIVIDGDEYRRLCAYLEDEGKEAR